MLESTLESHTRQLDVHTCQLDVLRPNTLYEWANEKMDSESKFERNIIAHGGDILSDVKLMKRRGKNDSQFAHFEKGIFRGYGLTFDDCVNVEFEGAPHALLSVLNMRANLSVMHAWKNKKELLNECELLVYELWGESEASPELIAWANDILVQTFSLGA